MDDYTDVIDFFMDDEVNENGEDDGINLAQGSQGDPSTGSGPSNQLELTHLQLGAPHLTPSQDQDFQSQDQVILRPRIGSGQDLIPEPRPSNVETEESTCPICFEHWTNSGGHRLVSIRCGHLFGESCILKWISQHRETTAKCPECNHPVKRKDVRRIWSRSVVVMDTAERDKAVALARKEQELRVRYEQDLTHSRMAYDMLRTEMAKLQRKHDHQRALKIKQVVYRTELKRLKPRNTGKDLARVFSCAPFKTVLMPTMPVSSSHYMSYRQDEEMLVCSRQVNFQHGIAKVSMRDFSSNLHAIIPVHSQTIRDMQCYTGDPVANKSLVLTASMDKTLKLTSASSQNVVLSYDLNAPVWSCCWSTTNPFTIYCSIKAKQTSILTLDLRNTATPVASFSQPSLLGLSPIHSMVHVGPSQTQQQESILCGNLEGAFIYNFESNALSGALSQELTLSNSQCSATMDDMNISFGQENERRILFRIQGASCSSVSFDAVSRHWMASYKFLGKQFTQHVQGYLDQDVSGGDLVLKSNLKVSGGPPVSCQSRTSVFSRQNGVTYMAAGSKGKTYVWCGSSESQPVDLRSSPQPPAADSSLRRLVLHGSGPEPSRSSDPVKDVKPIVIGHEEYLATLSDKELVLYRWSEEEEGEEDETGDSEIEDEWIKGWIKEADQEEMHDKRKKRTLEE